MAEKTSNPYGSAISRTGLFVYDPTSFMAKSLEKAEKGFKEGLEGIVARQERDAQYARDILQNIGELEDQAELEHNNMINSAIGDLIETTKSNMVKKGKLGLVSFNFNDPQFQSNLQRGIKRIKNGINNSKLLKKQYNDLVTFLDTNKDVVSNQVEIINRASASLINPQNIFTSNNVVNDFTSLRNDAIDEVKYINNMAQGLIEPTEKQTLIYETKDSRGKKLTVKGDFNKNLYEKDELGHIKRLNGKPVLNEEVVKNLRDEIINNEFTPEKAKIWLQDANNFEQFKDMITADLIIKERTEKEQADIDYTRASEKAKRQTGKEITTKKLFNISTSNEFKLYDVEGTELSSNNTVKYVNIDEDDYLKQQALGGIPIPRVIGIGYQNGKKALIIQRGDDKVVVTAGSNYADAFDSKLIQDLSGKDLIISEQDMNQTWDSVDTTARTDSFKGDDTEMYENTLNNAFLLSKANNTQSITSATIKEELSNLDNLIGESVVDNSGDDKVVKEKTLGQNISEYNQINNENSITIDEYKIVKDGYPARNSKGEIKARVTPKNIDTFVYDTKKGSKNNLASAFASRKDFEDFILKTKEIFNSQEYQDMLNRYNKFNEYLNNE